MRYIFKDGAVVGEYPVESFQIAFYDLEHNGDGYDESFIDPSNLTATDLAFIEEPDEKSGSKVFVNMKNGKQYELVLKECDGDCRNYYGN